MSSFTEYITKRKLVVEITYQFITNLSKILFAKDDEWKAEINNAAIQLPEKIKMLQTKLDDAKEQLAQKHSQKLQERISSIESQIHGISKSLEELQDQTKYAWNVEPFKNPDNAKLLLANIHILEDPALKPLFNPQAVLAIKNMLSERFVDIYDDEVNQLALSQKVKVVQVLKPETIKSIVTKNIPKIEEILTPVLKCEEATKMTSKLIKYYPELNQDIFSEITKSMLMISKFYIVNDHYLLNLFTPLVLSLCFENIEDVETFLSNHVNYQDANSFEDSFVQIQTLPESFPQLSPNEKKIWSKLIAENGKQAMGLFFRSEQVLHELGDKKIDQLLEECEGDIKSLFSKINTTAAKSQYDGASEKTSALATICSKYNISQEIFDRIAREILPQTKDYDELPDVKFDIEFKGQIYHFSKLPAGDLRGLFLGHETGCCQSIGGDSERSVQNAFTRTDAGFYVLTDLNGKIKAQSLAWKGLNTEGKTVLVLDSFEHNKDVASIYIPLMQMLLKSLDGQELYVGVGGQTPNTQSNIFDNIKSPEGFHRYNDSQLVYLIKPDTKLGTKYKHSFKEYSEFEEYIDDNFPIAFNKLYHDYYDVAKNLSLGNPCRDAKAIKLLLRNPKLQHFVITEMQYDEATEKPLETNITRNLLAWNIIRSGNIEFTFFHKFKILEALIEQNLEREQIIKIFNDYYTYYDFDPDLIQKIGYENITKLPYSAPSNSTFSWNMVKEMVIKLKHMSSEESSAGLQKILRNLEKTQAITHSTTNIIDEDTIAFYAQSIKFPESIDDVKQKALIAECLKRFDASELYKTPASILGSLFASVPETVLEALSLDQLFSLYNGTYFPNIKAIAVKIPNKTLVDFLAKTIEKDIIKHISYTFDSPYSQLDHYLILMNVDELIDTWNGSYFEVPSHIQNLASNYSEYIKVLEISQIQSLAKLLENTDPMCHGRITDLLAKWDKDTIEKLGLDNIVHFCDKNYYCTDDLNIDLLSKELHDVTMPEQITVSNNEQYNKIHIARRLTIPKGVSFEVDFPILGFYQNVPDHVSVSSIPSTQCESNVMHHCSYLIGNYGLDDVTLEHV